MALVTLPFIFTPGTTIKSADMMANLNAQTSDYNGNIQSVNVQAINEAKITFAGTGGHSHSGGTGGTPVQLAQGADLASQAALAVGDDGNFFAVSGTTPITSLVSKPNQRLAILRFSASLILTNSANIILQNNQSLVTQAGDYVALQSKGGGIWEEIWRRLATAPVAPVGTRRFGYSWTDVSNVAINPVTLRAGTLGMECEVAGVLLTRTAAKTLTMPSSLRALVAGTGNVTIAIGTPTLTFSSSQTLKVGDTVKTSGARFFTIKSGSGTSWTAFQNAAANEGPVAFTKSDPAVGRTLSGEEVSDAIVHVYAWNNGGALDFYLDTTAPVTGYHPTNTADRWSGVQLYNDPAGNLDPTLAWANGRTSWSLQGDRSGNYVKTSTTYLGFDLVNLRRQLFVPQGALLELAATFGSFQNSAAGAHQIAFTEDEANAAIEVAIADRTGATVQAVFTATRRKVAAADGQHTYALSGRSAAGSVTIQNVLSGAGQEVPTMVLQMTEP